MAAGRHLALIGLAFNVLFKLEELVLVFQQIGGHED